MTERGSLPIDVYEHWDVHILIDEWGNSLFKRDTPGCRFCDALSGRAARKRPTP